MYGQDDDVCVKASDNAGLYVCELLSYVSLNILLQKKDIARVVFLHVPKVDTEASVKRGVDVATALVTACVDSLPGDYKKEN